MSGIVRELADDAGAVVEGAEEAIEAAIGDVEAFIRPRPGGKIEANRQQRHIESLADEPVAQQDYLVKGKPVAVDVLPAAIGTARTITLGVSNPALPILPMDSTRRSAVIIAVDNDVYLSADPGQAVTAAASGGATAEGVFYLPAGIALPWDSTSLLWAGATTTATTTRISVITSLKGA
jgi:hypothetical protein